MADVADGTFTKHQVVADLADVVILTDLAEVPAAVGGVAVQAGADQHVVLDHQLLVHAADGVGEGDGLGAFAAHKFTGREQVDTGDLQLGRGHRALIAGETELGQVVGADLGLLEQRRHQAVGDAAVTGAFADGVDARVIGLHGVVDQDAAVAGDAGALGQLAVGANAGGHHHQIGGNHLAVLEFHRADAAFAVVQQFSGVLGQEELQAAVFQGFLQQTACGAIELTLQ